MSGWEMAGGPLASPLIGQRDRSLCSSLFSSGFRTDHRGHRGTQRQSPASSVSLSALCGSFRWRKAEPLSAPRKLARPMRRALAAGILLLLLALPGAPAQGGQSEACRAPVLSVQPAPAAVDPGTSYSLLFAVENPNGPPVQTVRAGVTTTAPAGWTAIAGQTELTLGPKNASFDVLAITAPNRGSGVGNGTITILV